jgi:hypothetical protein
MSLNAFLRLRQLLPSAPLVVARVVSHNATDDTSTLELLVDQADTDYAGGVKTGTQFVARGRTVAIGDNAFVRDGVVESQAPDQAISEIEIGRVVP